MRLRRQTAKGREYELSPQEARYLRLLIGEFPITPGVTPPISRIDSGHAVEERQRLLDEALAEQRLELKRRATLWLAGEQLKFEGEHWRLKVNLEEREWLLKLLNHSRLGCWHALGKPEDMEQPPQIHSAYGKELVYHTFMQLAGYFEAELLREEDGPA